MSIDVEWPEYTPLRVRMIRDCLSIRFSKGDITLIEQMSEQGQSKIFRALSTEGWSVPEELK